MDRKIAELAERQHGVVGRRQLTAAGIGTNAIEGRLRRGQLHRVHRGTYAVGHRLLSFEGRLLAAVLACGPDAVLSHRSAAQLWRLLPRIGGRPEVTRGGSWREPDSISVHRSLIPGDERTLVDGVPVTSVTRTLLDLSAVLSTSQLARARNEAEALGLTDVLSLPDLLRRYPGRRGVATLRAHLEDESKARGVTRSELERRFLALLERTQLPHPELNARVAVRGRTFEVDCLWRAQRIVVELDGQQWHGTSRAFERDRERDRLLLVDGWRVMRVTWRQLRDDATAVLVDLRRVLRG